MAPFLLRLPISSWSNRTATEIPSDGLASISPVRHACTEEMLSMRGAINISLENPVRTGSA